MKKLNVGIIGLGVGEQHLVGFLNSPFVGSISICDFDKEKVIKIKKKYPVKKIFENSMSMIDDNEIDIISIASFDNNHFSQIERALNNGKNIFCEKPICNSYDELKKIEKILLKKKLLKMTTNTLLRLSPRYQKLKKKIEKSYFGSIYYMELDYNYGRIHKLLYGWRGKIKNYSTTLGGGVHMIDLLLWFKSSYPETVTTYANNICTKSMKNKVNDFVVSLLKFADGSVAKISSNFGCVYPHTHRIMIYGKNKTFEQSYSSSFFLSRKKDGTILKKNDENIYPGIKKHALISNFLESIVKKKKLIISHDEMIQTMKLCLDINKSINL